jgi:hypothetical protein
VHDLVHEVKPAQLAGELGREDDFLYLGPARGVAVFQERFARLVGEVYAEGQAYDIDHADAAFHLIGPKSQATT